MQLALFQAAPPLVQTHAAAALAALALGAWQLVAPKGTVPHRLLGWAWVGLMLVVVLSSFGITGGRGAGRFSSIHGISLFTLLALPLAVLHVRRGRIESHRWLMVGLFLGALVITGAFTLLPGRLMGRIVFS